MQRFIRLMLVLSAVGFACVPVQAADPVPAPHTKQSLQKLYLGCFTELGYKPELDVDGDVKVRIEGVTYYVYVRPEQPTLFYMTSTLALLAEGADPQPALAAANAVNVATPMATVVLGKNHVFVITQIRVTKPEDVGAIFPFVIERMQEGRTAYQTHFAAPKKAGK